jgi:hypothetical protein
MGLDITKFLAGWPFEPGQVTARRIYGDDGSEKLQLRLDLGVLQMEVVGRPDGARPFGQESVLAHYEQLLQQHRLERGTDESFRLDAQACEILRSEGMMYYHRYLAGFVLEDYELVQRDTLRNLRLFDFLAAYAAREPDRCAMEQYRPYVIMMSTRAKAMIALGQNRPKAAIVIAQRGIEAIKNFYRRGGLDKLSVSCDEIVILKGLTRQIESSIPVDPVKLVKRQLAKAIRDERYEDAASYRDQLTKLSVIKPTDQASQASNQAGDPESKP